jgi:1,2-diacylglycerol 3-beta-galactosyltransferase
LVVSKAGPGTIAEAACCGAPILLMSRLPGQERGGVQHVTRTGAGRYLPRIRQLITAIGQLKEHPADLAAMRAASARLGRPGAADRLATMLDGLVQARSPAAPAAQGSMAAPAAQGSMAAAGRSRG